MGVGKGVCHSVSLFFAALRFRMSYGRCWGGVVFVVALCPRVAVVCCVSCGLGVVGRCRAVVECCWNCGC